MRLRQVMRERAPHALSKHTARPMLWALLPFVVIASLLAMGVPGRAQAAPAPLGQHTLNASAPADVFMQAIIAQDGQLAWQQLCPSLQERVPASALATLTNAQRAGKAGPGPQLSVDYVGAHAWAAGEQVRIYVVTARWPSGDDADALYVLRTQASGCIDGILGT